jgi:hypothetical protein
MENELKQARTMAEILAICAKYYDLNEPLGVATKAVVTTGVKSVIKMIKAKPKQ